VSSGGLFDGSDGYVFLSSRAQQIYDGVSYTGGPALFDGTAGYVLQANQAFAVDNGTDWISTIGLFNGSAGLVLQAISAGYCDSTDLANRSVFAASAFNSFFHDAGYNTDTSLPGDGTFSLGFGVINGDSTGAICTGVLKVNGGYYVNPVDPLVVINASGFQILKAMDVATLVSTYDASSNNGAISIVYDASGGPSLAFSYGGNWLDVRTGTNVST
jgi:hypothetical protein